ncbi:ankyrin [Anaeromyces robustus]|uniref:Ankyrin n=1 Tax=Anaeromyces robustus TaxID=1754192 RepID=A0A1Y1X8X2_9FUNG|nr:ankyrin [Anaeromyces robustus]|eukprot:ORX82168.1 ankyrin [Anaeromyces robustus]
MDYNTFVTEFLLALKNNDKVAPSLLDNNKKIIQENLGENTKIEIMDNFINLLINIIIKIEKKKKFSVIEKALKHNTMTTVYRYFQNSHVMIKAVEAENETALKCLMSMKVSPYVQDENGMNVLMYILRSEQCYSYAKSFASDKKCLNQEDNNGRTALFYTYDNAPGLWKLLDYGIDINHKDHDGGNVLIYCCKTNKKFKYFLKEKVDVNAIDNNGKTAAMYLAINGYYSDEVIQGHLALYKTLSNKEYSTFQKLLKAGCNFNYINEKGESTLSLLLKYMYKSTNPKIFDSYIRTLISLIFTDCDFNIPIDEDKNTALMVFLLANDMESFNFVLKHYSDYENLMNRKVLDLNKKNKNGESVTSLFMKSKNNNFSCDIIDYPTFNIDYTDINNRNNILMFSAVSKPTLIPKILNKKSEFIYEVNNKGENALILACKANNYESVLALLNNDYPSPIDCQDVLGNTALHYAIKCKNPIIIQELIKKGANDQLKNIEGQSPYDLAIELGDKNILEALKGALTSETLQIIKNNNQSKALNDIEEYLYPCISNLEYTSVNLTQDMRETEKSTYNRMGMEIELNELELNTGRKDLVYKTKKEAIIEKYK